MRGHVFTGPVKKPEQTGPAGEICPPAGLVILASTMICRASRWEVLCASSSFGAARAGQTRRSNRKAVELSGTRYANIGML